jgi:hypothetical protein
MITSTLERGNTVPPDAILSAVADEGCRAVLRVLSSKGEAMDINALTDQVAERVRYGGPRTGEHRQRVRTALHHVHLPKLEACGLLVHDTETKQVRSVNGELSQKLLTMVEPYEAREGLGP